MATSSVWKGRALQNIKQSLQSEGQKPEQSRRITSSSKQPSNAADTTKTQSKADNADAVPKASESPGNVWEQRKSVSRQQSRSVTPTISSSSSASEFNYVAVKNMLASDSARAEMYQIGDGKGKIASARAKPQDMANDTPFVQHLNSLVTAMQTKQ